MRATIRQVVVDAPEGGGCALDVEGRRDHDLCRHDGGGGEGKVNAERCQCRAEEAVRSEGLQQRDSHDRGRDYNWKIHQQFGGADSAAGGAREPPGQGCPGQHDHGQGGDGGAGAEPQGGREEWVARAGGDIGG